MNSFLNDFLKTLPVEERAKYKNKKQEKWNFGVNEIESEILIKHVLQGIKKATTGIHSKHEKTRGGMAI
ncbi:hypothetical protein A3B18_02020 [Candidatus Giovannonibacteria bacterium RIFCSPLOWO2_01_FULL_46_13]|uniref:Uncharacterized protein n=1 Tax=Candidatus Giovannonibacteria bacterium RIFCSPLOWO2_01_FULL_46_13 TaxID=1798352 RepID=A0A1F5X664_9BACT|nr:MAG: hypothetical protein A3B18_02020 [Candidatus Giovannonibacteria bacterium RIFCSPLOWO2_01_FULL_46_13]